MNDYASNEEYDNARKYFFALYRGHLQNAKEWRGHSKKMELWSLELAADCRAKLIYGSRIRQLYLNKN